MVQKLLLALLCVPLFWFAVFNPVLWVALAVLTVAFLVAQRAGWLIAPPDDR
jgi:hypothetical protein